MSHRSPLPRPVRLALALAILLSVVAVLPVRGASSIDIDARALVGGRYTVGGWAAVAVTLVNDAAATEGHLVVETTVGRVRRFVEMPAGARKEVALYVQPEGFQRELEVRYEEPNGTVTATVEVRAFEWSRNQVAIVGDDTGTLRPQLLGPADAQTPEPIVLVEGDLPERPEPLAGISVLVWAGDGGALGGAQRRSLERWVADGGQLVVVGGGDWQARTAGLLDLLPLRDLAAVDDVPQAALAAWAGGEEPPQATATVSAGALREDARALATADDGTPLLSMRTIGAGRVVLVGTDLASGDFRGWEDSPQLWSRIVPRSPLDEGFFGPPEVNQAADSMAQALNNLPELSVPPVELLLLVIVGYILLIGPLSYLVLRRLDRRELAWVTAPILVLLFTGCSYGIGLTLKGSDVIVNQIALVRSTGAGSTASVETYAGVFSPTRATYDLRVEADALIGRLRTFAAFGPAAAADPTVELGDPARLRELGIASGGFEAVRADGVVEHAPALAVTWRAGDGIAGTVTNVGDEPLEDVAFISGSGGEMIGDLGPGESAGFEVDERNINGSSAADQVYGFGGFDSSSAEQRRIYARRSVIESLVGYGGFVMPRQLAELGTRGPFLIGWRAGDGPLPIAVEGVEAQRYGQVVEVLSASPRRATGAVEIHPLGMSVSIVATDGDVEPAGPTTVALGRGSATFSLALPLEASGIAVDDVDIVAGNEPAMLLEGGDAFLGTFPPGFLVDVRDVTTGAWTEIGDLAEGARITLDEPARAVDATGRITVRVRSETEVNDFGRMTIFVSAVVSGVISE